jgi:hypothetical protein
MDDLVVEIPNQIAGYPYIRIENRETVPENTKMAWASAPIRVSALAPPLLADEDVVAVTAPATTSEELAFCGPPSS